MFRGEADEKTIRWFEKRFSKHASAEEELDKEKFMIAINNDQVNINLVPLLIINKCSGQVVCKVFHFNLSFLT